MAIITSKGVKSPHQLKGRRNVKISRDRRGCGTDKLEEFKEYVNAELEDINDELEDVNDEIDQIKDGLANEYSTTEKVIGTWIDGKPIYARTFTFARKTITDSLTNLVDNDFNCEKVIRGFITDDTNRESLSLRIRATDTKIQAMVDNHSIYSNHVYIEYTKTTDTPSPEYLNATSSNLGDSLNLENNEVQDVEPSDDIQNVEHSSDVQNMKKNTD